MVIFSPFPLFPCFQVILDLSALLDGDLEVAQHFFPDQQLPLSPAARKQGAKPVDCLPPPRGLSRLVVRVTADKALLTDELELKLNPLMVTLSKANFLPGIVTEAVNLKQYTKPHKY
jgi:hypothetical protein